MKKLFVALLSLSLIFALAACTNSGKGTVNDNGSINNNGNSSILPDDDMLGSSTPLTSDKAENKSTAQAKITADEAKSAALKDAGLNADAVTFLRSELDRDDGMLKYEVEFKADGVEYEYDIDADSGEILWVDKDYD